MMRLVLVATEGSRIDQAIFADLRSMLGRIPDDLFQWFKSDPDPTLV